LFRDSRPRKVGVVKTGQERSMSLRWALVGLLVMGTGVGCANSKGGRAEEGNEVKMSLDQVPAAAREALVREANGASITTVDREDGKNGPVYEADVMMNGKNWEIKVSGEGKVLSKKLDPEGEEKK
jgi:hypothetical protein